MKRGFLAACWRRRVFRHFPDISSRKSCSVKSSSTGSPSRAFMGAHQAHLSRPRCLPRRGVGVRFRRVDALRTCLNSANKCFSGPAFLSNFALWSESGYFDRAATSKPLLCNLWSLGIEEQFYILWPPLLWIAFKIKAAMGRLIAVLLVASFAVNIALSLTDMSSDFYLPVSRFWELLAGAALAWRPDMHLKAGLKHVISLAGIAAILISARLFASDIALSRLARFAARGGFGCHHPGRIQMPLLIEPFFQIASRCP